MAEIATIARPYAEALLRAAGIDATSLAADVAALASVAGNAVLRQFADNPKAEAKLVFKVMSDVLASQRVTLGSAAQNLLRTVLDNGRLAALPEIAAQFQALLNVRSGVSDARIESAFPIDAALLPDVIAALDRHFGRKLNAHVELKPELIGGIRVVVGDQVFDTSVKARLEQMKIALAA